MPNRASRKLDDVLTCVRWSFFKLDDVLTCACTLVRHVQAAEADAYHRSDAAYPPRGPYLRGAPRVRLGVRGGGERGRAAHAFVYDYDSSDGSVRTDVTGASAPDAASAAAAAVAAAARAGWHGVGPLAAAALGLPRAVRDPLAYLAAAAGGGEAYGPEEHSGSYRSEATLGWCSPPSAAPRAAAAAAAPPAAPAAPACHPILGSLSLQRTAMPGPAAAPPALPVAPPPGLAPPSGFPSAPPVAPMHAPPTTALPQPPSSSSPAGRVTDHRGSAVPPLLMPVHSTELGRASFDVGYRRMPPVTAAAPPPPPAVVPLPPRLLAEVEAFGGHGSSPFQDLQLLLDGATAQDAAASGATLNAMPLPPLPEEPSPPRASSAAAHDAWVPAPASSAIEPTAHSGPLPPPAVNPALYNAAAMGPAPAELPPIASLPHPALALALHVTPGRDAQLRATTATHEISEELPAAPADVAAGSVARGGDVGAEQPLMGGEPSLSASAAPPDPSPFGWAALATAHGSPVSRLEMRADGPTAGGSGESPVSPTFESFESFESPVSPTFSESSANRLLALFGESPVSPTFASPVPTAAAAVAAAVDAREPLALPPEPTSDPPLGDDGPEPPAAPAERSASGASARRRRVRVSRATSATPPPEAIDFFLSVEGSTASAEGLAPPAASPGAPPAAGAAAELAAAGASPGWEVAFALRPPQLDLRASIDGVAVPGPLFSTGWLGNGLSGSGGGSGGAAGGVTPWPSLPLRRCVAASLGPARCAAGAARTCSRLASALPAWLHRCRSRSPCLPA